MRFDSLVHQKHMKTPGFDSSVCESAPTVGFDLFQSVFKFAGLKLSLLIEPRVLKGSFQINYNNLKRSFWKEKKNMIAESSKLSSAHLK